jgi:hypothetical protein
MCTLRLVFPLVLDIRQLMKEIGPLRKVTNIPTAISYLKDHFFAPIDMEIPHEGQSLFLVKRHKMQTRTYTHTHAQQYKYAYMASAPMPHKYLINKSSTLTQLSHSALLVINHLTY